MRIITYIEDYELENPKILSLYRSFLKLVGRVVYQRIFGARRSSLVAQRHLLIAAGRSAAHGILTRPVLRRMSHRNLVTSSILHVIWAHLMHVCVRANLVITRRLHVSTHCILTACVSRSLVITSWFDVST